MLFQFCGPIIRAYGVTQQVKGRRNEPARFIPKRIKNVFFLFLALQYTGTSQILKRVRTGREEGITCRDFFFYLQQQKAYGAACIKAVCVFSTLCIKAEHKKRQTRAEIVTKSETIISLFVCMNHTSRKLSIGAEALLPLAPPRRLGRLAAAATAIASPVEGG